MGDRASDRPPAAAPVPPDRLRTRTGRRARGVDRARASARACAGAGAGAGAGARTGAASSAWCVVTARQDMAGRVLGWAVRLLSADRRAEWGQAMRAELAQLDDAPQRRRFAFGCLRGSLSGPRPLAAIGSRTLMLGLVAAAVVWTGRVT